MKWVCLGKVGVSRVLVGTLLPALLMGIFFATAAAAAAPINDDLSNRLPLQFGFADTRANAEATVEPDEPLTPEDPTGTGCNKEGNAASGGIQMDGTMWWEFTGTGGPVTVSTLSSNFDTVLAVYELSELTMVACNDDLQAADPTRSILEYRLASEVLIDSVAGKHYAIQVGTCIPIEKCGKQSGTVVVRVSKPPTNDNRANATPITAGAPQVATNLGATTEPGEVTTCGEEQYGKTVWFRYTAPAVGTAAFSAAGFDTLLSVYREDSATSLGCNDDLIEKQYGGSRWPMVQPAEPPVPVEPGDYLIQVGGFYDIGFSEVAARNGPLTVQVEFTPDLDLDNDGVNQERDCDEGNPDIRPGVPEVPNNEIDENCDGFKAFDRDGDGVLAPPLGSDCRDDNLSIHPGAPEIRGNRIDENCDTETPDFLTLPTRAALEYKQREKGGPVTRVVSFILTHVKKDTQVEIRCLGRHCPFGMKTTRIANARGAMKLPAGFNLLPGEELVVRTTKNQWIGHEQTFRIREEKKPLSRTSCLDPGGRRRPC
jgi:hypothetical protein